MAQNEAWSFGISMPAQNGDGVVELDFACRKWLGYCPHIIHSRVSNGISTKEWHAAPHDTNASRTSVPIERPLAEVFTRPLYQVIQLQKVEQEYFMLTFVKNIK